MKWVVRIWIILAIVLPALIGLALVFNPSAMAQPWVTIETLAHQVGTRDLIFSLLIVIAVFMLPKSAVALLLLGRGLIDLSDGIWAFAGGAAMPTPVVPIVLGIVSLVVAYLVWKMPGQRVFGAAPAAQ
jgi:hypothetical protein